MSKRILIVEDNNNHRLLTQDTLEHAGYVVASKPDGKDFLRVISEFNPDLILLDLRLPDSDGFALLADLQDSDWKGVPVIVMSAYTFQEQQQKALRLGARHYLIKPFSLDRLTQLIERELTPVLFTPPLMTHPSVESDKFQPLHSFVGNP